MLPLSADLKDDAEVMLLTRTDVKGIVGSERHELVELIVERRASDAKLSREQHLEKIAEAYATYVYLSSAPGLEEVVSDIAERIDYRITTSADPIRIIVGSAISYGSDFNSERTQNATRLYSRDVKAIHYLIERGIKPSEVVELSRRPGEGLDFWSRGSRTSKTTPRSQKSVHIRMRGLDGSSKSQRVPAHLDRACRLFLDLLSALKDSQPGQKLSTENEMRLSALTLALGTHQHLLNAYIASRQEPKGDS